MTPQMLLPETTMDVAEYRISGVGPGGTQFDATVTDGTVEIDNLRVGEWTLDVSAFNAEAIEIGYGRAVADVKRGETVNIGVAVRPLTGTGSLSISVSWTADELVSGNVVATLTSFAGVSTELQFESTGASSAEYHGAETAAGYYSLILQLRDDETVVAGAVETVRVVHGGSTAGVFSFEDLNHPTGDIEIVVVVDLHDPLVVEITGIAATLAYGESATALGAVQNAGTSTLQYSWYLNGASLGTGESVVLGGDLRVGTYRLDVIVFSADGARSGSAGHAFRVE